MAIKHRIQTEWFLYDLKKLIAQTRRIGRTKSFLALTPSQRKNLADTQQEVINELERLKRDCQPPEKVSGIKRGDTLAASASPLRQV